MTGGNELLERAREAPEAPGVYRFVDDQGTALYVGKARSLRRRLLSYFGRSDLAERTRAMLEQARDIRVTVTVSEVEALILENTLIKRLKPRFNVLLRDDKTYPYLRLTTGELWPRLELTRTVRDDGHAYFGPFMGQQMARRLLEIVRTRFPVRTCRIEIDGSLVRPCLYHDMGACLGPCVAGLTDEAAYAEAVEELKLFLSGKRRELAGRLERSMWAAAEREEFELAARQRDLLAVVHRLGERQNVEQPGRGDADVVAAHGDGEHASVVVLPYRDGKLVDARELHFEGVGAVALGELLATFLAQYYEVNPEIPPRVDLSERLEDDDRLPLRAFLAERRGGAVEIGCPQRGPRARRLELALANARNAFDLRFRAPLAQRSHLGRRLGEALGLAGPVRRLECFDVSHASGKETTASCVVWSEGRLDRRRYRSFLIRDVDGVDDFASLAEAVGRRYRRLRDEGGGMPDLVVVDGGPGQLNAALAALDGLGLELPLVAIAKREELLWRPAEDEPLRLASSDPAHLVLRRVRDEAHRFAVSRHRRRRRKQTLASELLGVPGIGPRRARALLRRFGSARGVAAASVEELQGAVGPRLGVHLWRHLHAGERESG